MKWFARLFLRPRPERDPYCVTCDDFHPVGAVRYSGQHLCHVAFGKPLPYVGRS